MRLDGMRKTVYFCELLQGYAFHQCLDEAFFSGLLPFYGVALLNWFTKSSKFDEGFKNNELS